MIVMLLFTWLMGAELPAGVICRPHLPVNQIAFRKEGSKVTVLFTQSTTENTVSVTLKSGKSICVTAQKSDLDGVLRKLADGVYDDEPTLVIRDTLTK